MLALPEHGMAKSVKQHNVNRNILCDWVEASVVFDNDQVSKSDVVKALLQNEVYDKQDFAMEIVDEVWAVISGRMKYLGHPLGIQVTQNRISRAETWDKCASYSFCLTLSCAELYSSWIEKWGAASIRGELFEELAQESFAKTLQGWTVRRIGWSPGNAVKLSNSITEIISDLNEVAGSELALHVTKHANELGLDLLAFYSYGDQHASMPVLMVQCASGKDWQSKRKTPDLDLWRTVISFNSSPVRGFAIPFAYADASELRKDARAVNGVFVDRNRLLGAFRRPSSDASAALNKKLVKWIKPLLASAPRDN
jgi:hypothetical protein